MGKRTGRMAVLGALLTAGALCFASVAQAQTITIGNAAGAAGQQVDRVSDADGPAAPR